MLILRIFAPARRLRLQLASHVDGSSWRTHQLGSPRRLYLTTLWVAGVGVTRPQLGELVFFFFFFFFFNAILRSAKSLAERR